MKILVVDDSSTMRRIIKNTLKRIGYSDIVEGTDGVEGLVGYQNNNIDMVITDWNMPNMSGLELVTKIRKINKDIPIIMITTEGGKIEVIKALKAGVNNYIVKPFTPMVLKEKLGDVLGII